MKSDTPTYARLDFDKLYIIMEWDGQVWRQITKPLGREDALRIISQIRNAKPERKITDYSLRSL